MNPHCPADLYHSRSLSAGPDHEEPTLGCRGRDASYLAPPAQIRTCSFPAYGSHLGYPRQLCAAVCEPASVTRLCGAESGACAAGPHSPWSPPFAPPAPRRLAPPRIAPQRIAPRCSSASQLLCSITSQWASLSFLLCI